jgi:hypothetical protein
VPSSPASIDGDLHHAGYIQTWIRLLQADERAFFTACSKAQAAADYLRGLIARQANRSMKSEAHHAALSQRSVLAHGEMAGPLRPMQSADQPASACSIIRENASCSPASAQSKRRAILQPPQLMKPCGSVNGPVNLYCELVLSHAIFSRQTNAFTACAHMSWWQHLIAIWVLLLMVGCFMGIRRLPEDDQPPV